MTSAEIEQFLKEVKQRDPHESEFLQAVEEVCNAIQPILEQHPELFDALRRLVEPERTISFRVAWLNDKGEQRVNRGWRVQFNSAIGPYKGGLRFHPSVNQSVVKFLGFEQIFKNALTTLPLGGAKGGSDFDPKGKSDQEVMRFCQGFMSELYRHIGAYLDIPAGDIGVGHREIGFLFGQYKRIQNSFEGTLTGKDPSWGGSLLRPEATGYGVAYFAKYTLEKFKETTLEGKRCVISGAGNVALYLAEELLEMGATIITVSDSQGVLSAEDGFTKDEIDELKRLRFEERKHLSEHPFSRSQISYDPSAVVWKHKCDFAFPCATQNEIDKSSAQLLLDGGCSGVFEGANMPCTSGAIKVFKKAGILFGPAKAANAGGVAVSGLEMCQNSQRMNWTRELVDEHLQRIMKDIFDTCCETAKEYGREGDLLSGANIAGFLKVARAMNDQGIF